MSSIRKNSRSEKLVSLPVHQVKFCFWIVRLQHENYPYTHAGFPSSALHINHRFVRRCLGQEAILGYLNHRYKTS